MRNKRIEAMTISAIIIAIIAIMSFVPYVGYIAIPGTPISVCTIHIVVILSAILFGWKQGIVAGLAFGGFSLLRAACMPSSPSDVLFVNPMVSVFPRILFGAIAGFMFDYVKRIRTLPVRTVLYVLASIFATAIHTTLVLVMLWVFNRDSFSDPFMLIIGTLVAVNGAIEMVSAGIIVPLLAKPIGKARKEHDPYTKTPYKQPIHIENIILIIVLFVFILLALQSMNWLAILPIVAVLAYLVTMSIVRRRKKTNE